MSASEQSATLGTMPGHAPVRLLIPVLAVVLAVAGGLATAWGAPELTIRFVSFATMIAAIASGVVAVRRGPAWIRALSAVVAVLALMLGSTFFGVTYS